MTPVAILGTGMVSGVGFSAPASCAAIRAGINGFVETRFMFDGDWLIGCPVPFEEGWTGRERLLQMAMLALDEAVQWLPASVTVADVPLVLCLAEETRPGRLEGLDDSFYHELSQRLSLRFHPESASVSQGRCGGLQAVDYARGLIARGRPYCLVAGVDSYLLARTLTAYHEQHGLLTADNSDGFIPGEAAAAVLLGPAAGKPKQPQILGIGFSEEPAPEGSGKPFRAEGLTRAIRAAMIDGGCAWDQIDYRITDLSGSQYGFKEAAIAASRVVRPVKPEFDIWHPADCVGQAGAAAVPVMLTVAEAACRTEYGLGPGVSLHCANDDAARGSAAIYAPGVPVQ